MCTRRSRMASAMVGSPMISCQCSTGSWLVTMSHTTAPGTPPMAVNACRPRRRCGGAQPGDEDVGATLLTGRGVEHRHRAARPVDEQLLAGGMRLPHRRRHGLAPIPTEIAEAAVPHSRRHVRPGTGGRVASKSVADLARTTQRFGQSSLQPMFLSPRASCAHGDLISFLIPPRPSSLPHLLTHRELRKAPRASAFFEFCSKELGSRRVTRWWCNRKCAVCVGSFGLSTRLLLVAVQRMRTSLTERGRHVYAGVARPLFTSKPPIFIVGAEGAPYRA